MGAVFLQHICVVLHNILRMPRSAQARIINSPTGLQAHWQWFLEKHEKQKESTSM
jgi:hypothetical protein